MKTRNNKRRKTAPWNIHPGEILREEFLKPMGMSRYELAKRLHVPAPRLNDIVLEKRGITADTALRLGRLFGTTTEFWMNLQAAYEIRRAEAVAGKQLGRIEPIKAGSAAWPTPELSDALRLL